MVDETEKGWFIQYIDRDPKLLAKQAALEQKVAADIGEEERIQRAIEAQIAATKASFPVEESVATELQTDGAAVVSLSLGGAIANKKKFVLFDERKEDSSLPPNKKRAIVSVFDTVDEDNDKRVSRTLGSVPNGGGGALAALRAEEERRKSVILSQEDSKNRKDYWLHPGIVVKIMNKTLSDGRFYKKKATVLRVLDNYVGEVRLNDSETIIRLDQADLETVVPKVI